ncbi:MAG: hypothetical protein WCT14_19330 [Treponemataceae bacterium]
MNDVVPSRTLTKYGVAAVGGIAGGVGLMVLNFLTGFPIIGLIAGGVVALVGLGAMASPAAEDKRAGGIATAAGGLTVLSHFSFLGPIAGIAGSLVSVGIIGLLGMGAWNAYKFVKGLKSRA